MSSACLLRLTTPCCYVGDCLLHPPAQTDTFFISSPDIGALHSMSFAPHYTLLLLCVCDCLLHPPAQTDTFFISSPDIGALNSLRISHDGSGLGPAWHLA
jgi:hypothetical protein